MSLKVDGLFASEDVKSDHDSIGIGRMRDTVRIHPRSKVPIIFSKLSKCYTVYPTRPTKHETRTL